MSLPNEIRRRMLERGYTAHGLSLAAGQGPTFVRDIIKGRIKSPRAASLQRIALLLDCTLEDLVGPVPNPSPNLRSDRVQKLQTATTKLGMLSNSELDVIIRLIDAVKSPPATTAA